MRDEDSHAVGVNARAVRQCRRRRGATGAVLTTKLIHSMRRDGLKRGLDTLCIGGGQGIALAVEVLH
jgi:hypothetical protein